MAAAARVTHRSGRIRLPTTSDSCPAAIRPSAPATCAKATRPPAAAGRPAPVVHQPDQGEGPDRELRHDQQHRDPVDARQEAVAAVGVRRRGRAAGRSRRVHDDAGPRRGRRSCTRRPAPTARRTAPNRSAVTAIVAAAIADADRRRGLPDAHRQAAAARWEPPDHDPAARRAGARRGRARRRTVRAPGAPARRRTPPRRRAPRWRRDPASSVSRSPRRSHSRPQATRVQAPPATGAPATSPASARVSPSSLTSDGMRNAGPVFMTVDAAWASVPAPSIAQRRVVLDVSDVGGLARSPGRFNARRGAEPAGFSWTGL